MTFDELLAKHRADAPKASPRHDEEDLQRACCRWYELQWGAKKINGEPIARALHHSPNGGRRNKAEAARFKAMGTRAGFPDLWLGIPVNGCPYLCIELKTLHDGSHQSDNQKTYERLVKALGAKYVVVRTLQEFITTINAYLAPLKL